jgi:hypothetical protein
MINILSFSTNADILPVMDRLVNKHSDDWRGYQAADLATAHRILTEQDINILLLGAGTGQAEYDELQTVVTSAGKDTKFVYHYGGGSGLLYAEIAEALR